MLPTDRLDYDLPPDLIATHPASPRDASRMMVVSRTDPDRLEHRTFHDLTDYLTPTDVLVRNRSAVLPARLAGRRDDSNGRIEGLFLQEHGPGDWTVMLKSNGRLREGLVINLYHPDDPGHAGVTLHIIARDSTGWRVAITPDDPAPRTLARVGATPLPPCILSSRRASNDTTPDERDRADYQTIYADANALGSVAAPTAGLHFTPALEAALASVGVRTSEVVLHVGAGTFAPVTADNVEDHPIHSEHTEVPPETVRAIADARRSGGRSVCVGTTTVRALESLGPGQSGFSGPTGLLISPGHTFRMTDALITNFHLPRSTLLAMVCALFDDPDPVERLIACYERAIEERYRFYSFGDAMLILP
ncbi:MAG: tRNA preQ1(34) S-adenosylmethionine ribosyltransferase-isomerase QueA [Planctomycetota bacterium]